MIAEVTLVWVLFADASKVRLSTVPPGSGHLWAAARRRAPADRRAGTVAAIVVLDLDPWAALLLGAALAPTDAALGASVMSNPRVPEQVRRALNVESGLNDGIATPIVLVAIAGVAADEGIAGVESPGRAVLALLVGVLAGVAVGGLGGIVTRLRPRAGLAVRGARRPRRPGPGAARLHAAPWWSTATGSSPPSSAAWSSATSPDAAARRRSTSSSSRVRWPR